MPPYKSSPARFPIELNPVDSSGSPMKKRGLILRSSKNSRNIGQSFRLISSHPLSIK